MQTIPPEQKTVVSPGDHLANERTFLAWIRTSVALMGFGFVVVKFALFIRQISLALDKPGVQQPSKGYSSEIGIFLVAIGVIIALYAYFRYRITEKQLADKVYRPSYLLAAVLTVLILAAGVMLVYFLVPNISL